jgi:hypothetical protein
MGTKTKITRRSRKENSLPMDTLHEGASRPNKDARRVGSGNRRRAETRLVIMPSTAAAPNDKLLMSVIDEWLVPCLIKQFLAERSKPESATL